jgi:DegV family protein with EDD domain
MTATSDECADRTPRVVVVTDSSARLPSELAEAHGIRVVPLHILVGGADLRDGVDEMPADLYDRQATTAGASPAELGAAYERALDLSGGAGVVAVHISGALSGTCGAADHAAAQLGDRVVVVDSRSAAMGAGFAALAAAECAATGADLTAVAEHARAAASRSHAFIVVQRLDSLRRSGRIGGAAAWLGTALSLKPLLRIDNGKLVLAQRVRTASKAVAAMIEQVCALVGDRTAAIAVHHVDDPDGAAAIADELAQRLPAAESVIVTDLGPVLAVHVGAGALGVAVELPNHTG